MSSPVNPMS
jgi:hypothetical protein